MRARACFWGFAVKEDTWGCGGALTRVNAVRETTILFGRSNNIAISSHDRERKEGGSGLNSIISPGIISDPTCAVLKFVVELH